MSSKKTAYLKEENLLTLLSQNNFIVPEIQREYVWGENREVIVSFLTDLKSKVGVCCTNCNLPSSENRINIGFLYSYKPDYVKVEHDRFLDENIIDGQQRFTTLFLLLFYCALKETKADGKNRKEEFLTLIRFEPKLNACFDFRVRDLTKRFMLELIEKVDSIEQMRDIDKQTWFLKDYQNDLSIKSMRKTLKYIENVFSDNTRYYNHLINYVVFWHFKTEATSQGEELYITMNARGEKLADNEVKKASLMFGNSEIYKWGQRWEEWQLFFWKNRDKKDFNPSADKGFNGFLSCIEGLEYYLKYKKRTTAENDVQKLLTFEKVEEYFNAFNLLVNKKDEFVANYKYSNWVQKCVEEIWSIFNKNETDWFADYQDSNKSTERNQMVFIWSWLYFITEKIRTDNPLEPVELFRVLRFFFIRYHNNNRSVSTLQMTIDGIIKNGVFMSSNQPIDAGVTNPEEETDTKLRTLEESIKYLYLNRIKDDPDFYSKEELIWQIEDHPLNLDGSDVGNINITHLLDLNDTPSVDTLTRTRDAFFDLFPNNTVTQSASLKTILLFYGRFWKDTSYYHKRYDFSDSKKNVRRPEFKVFIKDFIGRNHESLLTELQNKFINEHKEEIIDSLLVLPEGYFLNQKLAYYSLLLPPEKLWAEGEKIIIREDVDSPRLFKDENQIIYNSKGSFKGHWGNSDLWNLVKKNFNDPLAEIKRRAEL